MSQLEQSLVSLSEASAMIASGATLAIAGDERALAALPKGQWIGGTIPYFMGPQGGITTREQVFVTPVPVFAQTKPVITYYDAASLSQVCVEAPANGYSLIVLPAFSDVHLDFAHNAPMYDDMYMKPLVGWVSGIHLDDLGKQSPKVCDGRSGRFFEDVAVAIHVPLPANMSAHVSIVNLFRQGDGASLEFESSGFEASQCLVSGQKTSLAKYLAAIGHDTRLPLVADYCGAQINVSLKAVDQEHDLVEFYGPVFPGVTYKLAKPFDGTYETAFMQDTLRLPKSTDFSCNCILNYLYGELEGRQTGGITGPMTFGEVAYQLLNQTLVHLTLQTD